MLWPLPHTIFLFYHVLDQQAEAGRGLPAAAHTLLWVSLFVTIPCLDVPTGCPENTGWQEGGLATGTQLDQWPVVSSGRDHWKRS